MTTARIDSTKPGVLRRLLMGVRKVFRDPGVYDRIDRHTAATRDDLIGLLAEVRAARDETIAVRTALDTHVTSTLTAVGAPRIDVADQAHATRQHSDEMARITREHTSRLIADLDAVVRRTSDTVGLLASSFADLGLDRWKLQELEVLLRYHRRQSYEADIATGRLLIPRLTTDHPIAVYSNDTIHPRGAKADNSICPRFNRKLLELLGRPAPARILDVGCAGGGLVRSFLDEGHFAVGLEGSDYPLINQTGEWGTIPRHLFTCDATQPFKLTNANTGDFLRFDAITAWELLEHIPEDRIKGLLENLERHLAPGGYLLFSVATFLDWDPVTGVIWHVTVQPREWWVGQFAKSGFEEVPVPLGKHDWVRGSGHARGDWHTDEGKGFHIALRRQSELG